LFDTLLSTGNDYLVEHTKNDSYWADGGDGTGKNMLGIILMEVRDSIKKGMNNVEVIQGDITNLNVDAIVNAANKSLTGGGGVDGAIHRAAGPELKMDCAKYRGCKTGEARVSSGYDLPAKYVIHAVGPVWYGGDKNEDEKLCNAYNNSMLMAEEIKAQAVAFPNISTGAFRFPFDRATAIQRFSIVSFLMQTDILEEVKVVCFSDNDLQRVKREYLKYRE
jgi:O-acetyl-ADP-ribose deacetylase (regulator of RNase III)